jgi:DNA-binding MarR family transcriptional regulator
MTMVRDATATVASPSPEVGPLAADLRLLVGRLARRLRQRGEAGISASLLSAMWTIERLQPVTLGDLAVAERVQPPTVTRIASKLDEMGLVVREVDLVDRRVSRVRLTREGQGFLDRTRTLRTAYLATRLRAVSEADRHVLRQSVEILTDLLEREEGS